MTKKNKTGKNKSKPRVLIADDDIALRTSLTALFKLSGFTVSCAGTINQVIETLRKHHFDVVILDMRMPLDDTRTAQEEKDGAMQVLAKIAEIRSMRRHGLIDPDTPIIVFTAYPSVSDAVRVVQAGAYYLPKTLPGRNMAEGLVSECKRLIAENRRMHVDPNQTWLAKHYGELSKKFGGKTIAVVDTETAKANKLKGGTTIGNRVVYAARNSRELTEMIVRSPAFRRSMPVILDVLENTKA